MKKISENASCCTCAFRGEPEGEFFTCQKRVKPRRHDVCKKYKFDPFSPRVKRQRHFDTSMFDPADFEIE